MTGLPPPWGNPEGECGEAACRWDGGSAFRRVVGSPVRRVAGSSSVRGSPGSPGFRVSGLGLRVAVGRGSLGSPGRDRRVPRQMGRHSC